MTEFAFLYLAALVILAAPILALIALARVRRLERHADQYGTVETLARLQAVERRLERLEESARPSAPTAPLTMDQRAQVSPSSHPLAERQAAPLRRRSIGLETRIAGRWLNRIGIAALLLAIAFFLKYAFDNDWVGDRGRVAIGLLCGASLLVYSQWLLKRGYGYFSDGIAGLGGGTLYLSLFAAWDFFHLVPHAVAFGGMIIVTTALTAIAVGRNSQPVAFLALMGGFLTPVLLSTGRDAQVVLFTYLAVLNAGLLILARARNWRALPLACLAATISYYWSWEEAYYSVEKMARTAFFATLFYLEFAIIPILQARQEGHFYPSQIALVLLNNSSFLLALHVMLYQDYRWSLTAAVLALAAAQLALPRLRTAAGSPARLLFDGLALTFITLAIPIRLEGKWITMSWAVEGAILVWSGFRINRRGLRWAGLGLLGGVALRLLLFPIPAQAFLMNPRFATFAVSAGCSAAAYVFSRRNRSFWSGNERYGFGAAGIAVHLLLIWALSMEVWDLFGRVQTGVNATLAQQLALSLIWTLYATALMVAGAHQASPALRWQGLVLFGLVVGKIFVYDLSSLERAYRIVSFLVLGVLLLVVSFLYQRSLSVEEDES